MRLDHLLSKENRPGGHDLPGLGEKFRCSILEELGSFAEGNACSLENRIGIEGRHRGGVAQLGEHLPCKQGVMGSNPIISTSADDRAW